MNTSTGSMITAEAVGSLQKSNPAKASKYKPIPDSLLPQLEGMNREQRRDWYKKNKNLVKMMS